MPHHEIIGNFHMHTPYSDGTASHAQIAEAAIRAGLDAVIVTDHNVWVKGPEHFYGKDNQRVLMLVGEEIHDPTRPVPGNHLLVYNAQCELSQHSTQPGALLTAANATGALTFLAHPHDPPLTIFKEPAYAWHNWEVTNFTGLEIWNYMSEFKSLLTSLWTTVRYALNPQQGIRGPFAPTLAKWDELTAQGAKVVAIGNADAHGTEYSAGWIKRVLFPYEFLFRQVNTHVLIDKPFTGDVAVDRDLMINALKQGHCFVAYDGAAPTKGFRFSANSAHGGAIMGDEVSSRTGVTLQIAIPQRADIRLIKDGKTLIQRADQTHITYTIPTSEAGVYRVEVHLRYQGRLRGWIYSNPIYVRA